MIFMKNKWMMLSLGLSILLVLAACSSAHVDDVQDGKDIEQNEDREEGEKASNAQNDAVVMIEDHIFDEADLAFYTFIEKVKIEIDRADELLELTGEKATERQAYWDEQLNYLDNVNVQLQNMIELYAMRLLAEEKHYDVPVEKLNTAIDEFKEKAMDIDTVQDMILEYGEKKFNRNIQDYMRSALLRDRVVNDLMEVLKEENPGMDDAEIDYLLEQRYEELFIEQMNDLELEMYIQ